MPLRKRLPSRRAVTALTATLAVLPLTVAVPAHAVPSETTSEGVRVLGETTVDHAASFRGTTVGGLSSIDYDPRSGRYVLLSDDRSAVNPSRFYTARIPVSADGVGDVRFTGTRALTDRDGAAYGRDAVDPEELRVDPLTGDYVWSQEGGRTADGGVGDPSVRVATPSGRYVRDLPLPANEHVADNAGPRENEVLEGLTFAAHGALVVSSVEGPLAQDGEAATPAHGALSRVTVQARYGPAFAQYAYPQEPVFATPADGGDANNGVASVLAVNRHDPTRLLVLERAYVSGVGNRIRIFEADTSGASNVLHVGSLADAEHVRPMRKRLLADLGVGGDLPIEHVDNIEGMTWGPRLPDGERSLLLVSDDNFSDGQLTQVLALGVDQHALGGRVKG